MLNITDLSSQYVCWTRLETNALAIIDYLDGNLSITDLPARYATLLAYDTLDKQFYFRAYTGDDEGHTVRSLIPIPACRLADTYVITCHLPSEFWAAFKEALGAGN